MSSSSKIRIAGLCGLILAAGIAIGCDFGKDGGAQVDEEYYCDGNPVPFLALHSSKYCPGPKKITLGAAFCVAEFAVSEGNAPSAIGLLQGGKEFPYIADRHPPLLCLQGRRMSKTLGAKGGTCTATLVAEDLIVTAKHCVESLARAGAPIYWYPKFWPFAVPQKPYKYQGQRFELVAKPIYESRLGQGDLALVRLKQRAAGIAPLAIKVLPKPSTKLQFYGHIVGSSLVKVDWSTPSHRMMAIGPSLLSNQVFQGGNSTHEQVASMFCASADQADGASGGPFIDKTAGAVIGVLWGGPKDTDPCGENPPGDCKADDDCLTPVRLNYFGDIATRTDILCMPGVLPEKIRDQLTCIF